MRSSSGLNSVFGFTFSSISVDSVSFPPFNFLPFFLVDLGVVALVGFLVEVWDLRLKRRMGLGERGKVGFFACLNCLNLGVFCIFDIKIPIV